MGKYNRYISSLGTVIVSLLLFTSCDDFFNPVQDINITEDKLFDDWYEYRSVAMGLYGFQAELVEQLLILGELRGDLLQITENADEDLVEVYNFNISKGNKYASPAPFFQLISACNNFIKILEEERPEVTDPNSPATNYDKLYGEVLCMRAWTYFTAVRIYGKVPFIHESLTTIDEIESFINSSGTYIDSVHIVFGIDGFENDTTYNAPISLEKQFFDESLVIDYFTNELKTKVKAVGVNHYSYNNDQSWEVSIWNIHAMNALLGSMYLAENDLSNAVHHFKEIIDPLPDYRYQLDNSFSNNRWINIFAGIDEKEHIYTLSFNKSNFQQNRLQEFFEPRSPHKYMLKPTKKAVVLWESLFDNYSLIKDDSKPWNTRLANKGRPGDFYRGYGASYTYMQGGRVISPGIVQEVLNLKSIRDYRTASSLIGEVDTVVWKYSLGKNVYDQDANFTIYRAAGIHLWLAEAYVHWKYDDGSGLPKRSPITAERLVNDGSYYSTNSSRQQRGVRGRVGFGGANDGIRVLNINYLHDPETNEVIGYIDVSGNDAGLRLYLEELIIDERARELAFEGERFYDLMRIARRRGDPSYLAKRVSEKFPAEKRDQMYNYLLNEENWYINYFE